MKNPKETPSFTAPHNPDAEAAVLGAIMVDQSSHADLFGVLRNPEVFHLDQNQKTFAAMLAMYDAGQKIDLLTLVEQLKKQKSLTDVGGARFVAGLASKAGTTEFSTAHARIILEDWMKRQVAVLGYNAFNSSIQPNTDVFDVVNTLENGVNETLSSIDTGSVVTMKSLMKKQEEKRALRKLTGYSGTPCGFVEIDDATNGLQESDLIILAARPGMGKTAFALNIARNLCKKGNPVGFFSLEMSDEQLALRMTSTESGVFHSKLQKEQLNDFDERNRAIAEMEMAGWPLFVEDRPGLTARTLRAKATLMKKKHGIKLLIVDYLQLMASESGVRNQSRENLVSDVSRSLKLIAKELNIPVIALAQLNRELEKRSDKTPILSDLRDSGSIEQDADEVWFLMRPSVYGITGELMVGATSCMADDLAIWVRAKARHGEMKDIPLRWHGATLKFSDYNDTQLIVGQPAISMNGRIEAFEKEPF